MQIILCPCCIPKHVKPLLVQSKCVLFEKHHIKEDWFSSRKCQTSAYNAQLHFSETAKFRKSHRPDRSLTYHDRCDRYTTLLPEMSSNRMGQSMKGNKSSPDSRTIFCTCIREETIHFFISLETPILTHYFSLTLFSIIRYQFHSLIFICFICSLVLHLNS